YTFARLDDLLLVTSVLIQHTPRLRLFPYTTLFRSYKKNHSMLSRRMLHTFRFYPAYFRTCLQIMQNLIFLQHLDKFLRYGCKLLDRKSTRLNSSHVKISYAVFCLKKKITQHVEASI